jgi:GNAT superfamily N-acetyltransferase
MLELRRYEESDASRVWCLHDEGLRQMDARWGDGPWDDDLRSVDATYLGNRGEFLVGTVNGEVVAMGALRRVSATAAEIKRMRVDVRFQRQGFGRVLLKALEDRANELGLRTPATPAPTRPCPTSGACVSRSPSRGSRSDYAPKASCGSRLGWTSGAILFTLMSSRPAANQPTDSATTTVELQSLVPRLRRPALPAVLWIAAVVLRIVAWKGDRWPIWAGLTRIVQ